jgi:alpha-L-rhamnosidase
LETPHGLLRTRWDRTDDGVELDLTVPDGTTAVLRLPGRDDEDLPAGTHRRVFVPSDQ